MQKKPIVFVHGDLQNKTIFYKLSEFFSGKGHEIVLIDLPGHGLEDFSINHKDLGAYLYNKTKNLKDPIFITNSSGSAFVAKMHQKHKNASVIAMINPLLTHLSVAYPGMNIDSLYNVFMDKSRKAFKTQSLFDYSKFIGNKEEMDKARFENSHPEGVANNLDFYLKFTDKVELSETDIPILLIASSKDEMVPYTYYTGIASKLRNCKLCTIEAGHDPLITNWEEIIKIFVDNYYLFS